MNTGILDDAVKAAKEIEAELQKPETHERKIRFDDGSEHAKQGMFVKKGWRPHDLTLEELALGRMILNARGAILPDELESRFQSLAERAVKQTLTTDGTATGAELIDTTMWTQLFEDIHASTLVADLFAPFINMNSKSMELPEMGDAVFYKPAGEGQAVTATDLATAKRTLTAYTLKAQVDISDEEDEDAIIAALASIRMTLVRNAREVIDSVILNGDTTGTTGNINKYGAAVAGTENYLIGFDGLIHYCLNEVTGQKSDLTTLETADFATLLGLLGKYADVPERCAFILDRWANLKALQLDDFRTVDKFGPAATLLRGQIGAVYNVPVIMSSQLAKSDANGRIDGVTAGNNTRGRIVLVNRDMWKVGMRRSIRVATERSEAKTMTSIVASMRIGLQCFGNRSSADYAHVALGYDITV